MSALQNSINLHIYFSVCVGVEAFKPHNISETILRRLLKHDVIHHIKVKNKDKARQDPATVIYQQVSKSRGRSVFE